MVLHLKKYDFLIHILGWAITAKLISDESQSAINDYITWFPIMAWCHATSYYLAHVNPHLCYCMLSLPVGQKKFAFFHNCFFAVAKINFQNYFEIFTGVHIMQHGDIALYCIFASNMKLLLCQWFPIVISYLEKIFTYPLDYTRNWCQFSFPFRGFQKGFHSL